MPMLIESTPDQIEVTSGHQKVIYRMGETQVAVVFQRWEEPELEVTSTPTSFGCGPSKPGEWKQSGQMVCNEKSLSEITVQKVFSDLESFEKNGALGTMLRKVVTDKAADKAGEDS